MNYDVIRHTMSVQILSLATLPLASRNVVVLIFLRNTKLDAEILNYSEQNISEVGKLARSLNKPK